MSSEVVNLEQADAGRCDATPRDWQSVCRALHRLIHERLFGDRPWSQDRETLDAIHGTLLRLGVIETVSHPDEIRCYRNSDLGNAVNVDLLSVFLGLREDFEAGYILEEYGLIDEAEVYELFDVPEFKTTPERRSRVASRQLILNTFNHRDLRAEIVGRNSVSASGRIRALRQS